MTPAAPCGCLLIIPSARLAPAELQAELGPIPSGMVPYRGRPAYAHIIGQVGARADAVAIAVGDSGALLAEHAGHAFGSTAQCVDVGPTTSLGATISAVLDDWCASGLALPTRLRIQFADTLIDVPGAEPADSTVIYHGQAADLYRWTCFTVDEAGAIERFIEKDADKAGEDVYGVVIGAFAIADVAGFHRRLRAACDTTTAVDPFYAALREHFNAAPAARRALRPVRRWTDLGHLDTYYAARRQAGMNARAFNALDVRDRRGVIRKTSANRSKLADEIRWYLRLPKTLAHLAPRVLDYDLDPQDPFVEMEFYGYPALSDMYLYGAHDGGVWERVMAALGDALDLMGSHRLVPGDPRDLTTALRSVYQEKTADRIAGLPEQGVRSLFARDVVTINGLRRPGLAAMIGLLPRLADAVGLYDCPHFTVIHGDFCLSNLLFDRRNCFLRCIDPRGRFGGYDIYGDPHYDLAKLRHSFVGGYDFMVNGLVRVDADDGGDVRYTLLRQPRHRAIERQFARWLARRCPDTLARIGLIESLLFISMTPLHADRPDAQIAMMATGLDQFGRLAQEAGLG
ncbi:MAG: aminoglycoside phosphotransferase family protein [Alphaproteobacteria bacterium]